MTTPRPILRAVDPFLARISLNQRDSHVAADAALLDVLFEVLPIGRPARVDTNLVDRIMSELTRRGFELVPEELVDWSLELTSPTSTETWRGDSEAGPF